MTVIDFPSRRRAFQQLLEAYSQDASDYDEGEEEDPRPYLDGAAEIERYVCVTANPRDDGWKFFFLPVFDSAEAAIARAVEYAHDDIFAEIPVEVVDLDTGKALRADLATVDWNEHREHGPGYP